jgi:hypothetical protein
MTKKQLFKLLENEPDDFIIIAELRNLEENSYINFNIDETEFSTENEKKIIYLGLKEK